MINISIAAARLDINSVYGSILFGKNTAGRFRTVPSIRTYVINYTDNRTI